MNKKYITEHNLNNDEGFVSELNKEQPDGMIRLFITSTYELARQIAKQINKASKDNSKEDRI